MGYINHLTINVTNETLHVRFIKSYFETAKITDSNLSPDKDLAPNSGYKFTIDDKNNRKLMDQDVLNRYQLWKFGVEEFLEEDLKFFQYMKFEIDSKAYYLCFTLGVEDDYCLTSIFPLLKPFPGISTSISYLDGYFEQHTFINIY